MTLRFGEYVIRGELSVGQMEFAIFCRMGPKEIKVFLKTIAPRYYGENIDEYINSIVNQVMVYRRESCYLIRTYSREFYRHSKMILEQAFSDLRTQGKILFYKNSV